MAETSDREESGLGTPSREGPPPKIEFWYDSVVLSCATLDPECRHSRRRLMYKEDEARRQMEDEGGDAEEIGGVHVKFFEIYYAEKKAP